MKGDFRKKTRRDMELRRLASKVRDERHLDRIVRSAPGKMQDAIRGLLLQHVKFSVKEETTA